MRREENKPWFIARTPQFGWARTLFSPICLGGFALLVVLFWYSSGFADRESVDPAMVQEEPVDQPAEPRPSPPLDLIALDRPVNPETYLVGPGDELAVNVWGGVHRGFKIKVSPEATAILPTVGEIPLSGLTLAQAKKAILRRIGSVYPGVPATVTLVQVRSLKVIVAGVVEQPGIYLVTANVRASEVIEFAGWQQNSSRRRILLYRGDDTLRVDELRFARTGDEEFNPYLTGGDQLYVPHARTIHGVFEVHGSVNRFGVFEVVEGDCLNDAIELAFGFSVDADTTAIELIRFVGEDSLTVEYIIDLTKSGPTVGRNLPLEWDDRVYVRPRVEYRPKSSAQIEGEVIRPGVYPIINGQTMLSELLMRCGGVTEEADVSRATLIRGARFQLGVDTDERIRSIPGELQTTTEREWILAHSLSPAGLVSVDLQHLLEAGDKAYDQPLWDGDAIYIPRFLPQINVIGRVRYPGVLPYESERGLDYYLERAGGLSWRADRSSVFVVKGTTGMPVEKKKIKKLDAGDTIVIPTVREKKFWPVVRDVMIVLGNVATLYLVIDQAVK